MLRYLYDGTFDGFLSAVARSLETGERPQAVLRRDQVQCDFFARDEEIRTDVQQALSLRGQLASRISPRAVQTISYAFLADRAPVTTELLAYTVRLYEAGREISGDLSDDLVRKVVETARAVGRERHRYLGLLRFRALEDGLLYAEFSPDHNVLPILYRHFERRLAGEDFLIYDRHRQRAILHRRGEGVASCDDVRALLSERETTDYESLWRAYFQAIAIENRRNPTLQRSQMPKKYWRDLTEMQGSEPL